MTQMITISGAEYHLAGPSMLAADAHPINLADIAHHLSLINRFTGATTRPYSVAEHSLLCSKIAQYIGGSLSLQMAALMHDAHEAYVTDLSSPAKVAVNSYSMGAGGIQAWGLFEDVHAKIVRQHFGLLSAFAAHRDQIREIDLIALATERRDLTAYDPKVNAPWPIIDSPVVEPCAEDLNSDLRESRTWRDWKGAFIDRFLELTMREEAEFHGRVIAAGSVC